MVKSLFGKGGFRGISGGYLKSPLPPFFKGGTKTVVGNALAITRHHHGSYCQTTTGGPNVAPRMKRRARPAPGLQWRRLKAGDRVALYIIENSC
jgi:hypothetical protein